MHQNKILLFNISLNSKCNAARETIFCKTDQRLISNLKRLKCTKNVLADGRIKIQMEWVLRSSRECFEMHINDMITQFVWVITKNIVFVIFLSNLKLLLEERNTDL